MKKAILLALALVLSFLIVPTSSCLILGYFSINIGTACDFLLPPSIRPLAPPSFNEPEAHNKIEKHGRNYVVRYQYRHKNDVFVLVGKSVPNLEKYIDRQVRIKGQWHTPSDDSLPLTADTQCVGGSCHKIFQPTFWESQNLQATVVNIDTLEETY